MIATALTEDGRHDAIHHESSRVQQQAATRYSTVVPTAAGAACTDGFGLMASHVMATDARINTDKAYTEMHL